MVPHAECGTIFFLRSGAEHAAPMEKNPSPQDKIDWDVLLFSKSTFYCDYWIEIPEIWRVISLTRWWSYKITSDNRLWIGGNQPSKMADQIFKLLKDEGLDSVEDMESDTAQLRQKLDIAISKKQEKLINSLSLKLANRGRLQEGITGRTPLARQDNVLACLFDHLYTCLSPYLLFVSQLWYLLMSTKFFMTGVAKLSMILRAVYPKLIIGLKITEAEAPLKGSRKKDVSSRSFFKVRGILKLLWRGVTIGT